MKKKVLAMAAAFAMLCTPCLADGLDYASMSDEELHAVVDGARNELASRELTMAGDTVLLDQDGVKVYLTGNNSLSGYSNLYFSLGAVVINDSNKKISVSIDNASINGWDVYSSGISETTAGKKQKGDLDFNASDADVKEMSEIEDVEFVIRVYDCDKYETIFKSEPITLHPVAE